MSRFALHDLTGDGQVELLVPDSGTDANVLHFLRLKWPTVATAAAGAAPAKPTGVHARAEAGSLATVGLVPAGP